MSRGETLKHAPQFGDMREHRGYVVTLTLHGFEVTMAGVHVCWALSFDDGVLRIDELLGVTAS